MVHCPRVGPKKVTALGRWAYNSSGFNKLGLMHNDCYAETPAVIEAVRRLPPDVYDARTFRMMRALDLSMKKSILPKCEWTKYEKDVRYLDPYLHEVLCEMTEKWNWNNNL